MAEEGLRKGGGGGFAYKLAEEGLRKGGGGGFAYKLAYCKYEIC